MMNILLIAPNWLGDLIMSQSLIKWLKIHYKPQKIDMLAPKSIADAVIRMPEVNQVISHNWQSGKLNLAERFKCAKKIQNRYDWAIILPVSFKSALIPAFAKIPKRTGFLGECRYGLINDVIDAPHKLGKNKNLTQRAIYLSLLKVNEMQLSEKEKQQIIPQLEVDAVNQNRLNPEFQINPNKKLIAFAMGSNYGQAKRWSIANFGSLAQKLIEQNCQILLLGSNKERQLAVDFLKNKKIDPKQVIDAIGKNSLAKSLDLLSLCSVLVSNDSGLMHVANALKVKTIIIYGSSSPVFTPPLAHNESQATIFKSNLPCAPCFERTCRYSHYNCLKQTTDDMVAIAVKKMALTQ